MQMIPVPIVYSEILLWLTELFLANRLQNILFTRSMISFPTLADIMLIDRMTLSVFILTVKEVFSMPLFFLVIICNSECYMGSSLQ